MTAHPLDGLDPEARANLDDRRFAEYLGYKRELIRDGFDAELAEDVLRGWIWGVLESEGGIAMTESEYIDATNLAKLRIAESVLRDFTSKCTPDSAEDDARVRAALTLVSALVQEHYARIKIEWRRE